MSKSSVLVSILMPVYNEELYICEAIQSVLEQSESNFELIIINDGSTDNTSNLVKKFNDSRIVFLEPGKAGKNAAFNLGFRVSRGRYIAYFAGDDIMPVDSLRTRVEALQRSENDKKACCGRIKTFSKQKKYDGIYIPKSKNRGVLTGGALMMSREVADMVFPLPEHLPNEDTWTGLVIRYLCEKPINVPHVVLVYRIHEDNSNPLMRSFEEYSEKIHRRFIAFELFYMQFRSYLDKSSIRNIKAFIKAEEYRYAKKTFNILLISELNFIDMLRFVVFSNNILYFIRNYFYRYFSGWSSNL